jgi:hypothetical protein
VTEYDPSDPRLDRIGRSVAELRDYAVRASVDQHGPEAAVGAAEVADTVLFSLISRHGSFFLTGELLVLGVAADPAKEEFQGPLGEFVLDVGGVTAEMIFHDWIRNFSSYPPSAV